MVIGVFLLLLFGAVSASLYTVERGAAVTAVAAGARVGAGAAPGNPNTPNIEGAAAEVVNGHKVANGLYAMVVPGSQQVKIQAEREGLDEVFKRAGFDWRGAGCSMCLGMNPDVAAPGERVASTSNRNFEGRQGRGARSHLVSPQMAAAAAIEGRFVDIREWQS